MTWVKICGITNLEDARVAIDAGADALGFVFYHDSPRYLSAQAARRIIENLPEKIVKVAVFADASSEQMSSAARDSKAFSWAFGLLVPLTTAPIVSKN